MKMKWLVVFILAFSLGAFAQGKGKGAGKGHGQGHGASVGQVDRDDDHGRGKGHVNDDRGRDDFYGNHVEHRRVHSGPLSSKHEKTGAWKMLQRKTGMTSAQLRAAYRRSGAKNFGQFVSGMVAARDNKLHEDRVFEGLRRKPLEDVLIDLGIPRDRARDAVIRTRREVYESEGWKFDDDSR